MVQKSVHHSLTNWSPLKFPDSSSNQITKIPRVTLYNVLTNTTVVTSDGSPFSVIYFFTVSLVYCFCLPFLREPLPFNHHPFLFELTVTEVDSSSVRCFCGSNTLYISL